MSAELVEAMFSRATGAGIDPHDYRRTMGDIAQPAAWAPACAQAADRYRASADRLLNTSADHRTRVPDGCSSSAPADRTPRSSADRALRAAGDGGSGAVVGGGSVTAADRTVNTGTDGGSGTPTGSTATSAGAPTGASTVTRGEYLLLAARWSHLATLIPDEHQIAHARAADSAAEEGFSLLEPGTRANTGHDFNGLLRTAAQGVGTVVIVPGLDSSKEEFHLLADALVRRGVAVFAMNGPGQGAQVATSTMSADYPAVISAAIDALGVDRVGVVGLSLGGYYAAAAAARDPRITVAATVSGPHHLDWTALPEPIRELMARRAGSVDAAEAFAATVDLSDTAPHITCPLLVVDGADDRIPGVTNGEPLARLAPRGRYLSIPGGDHLIGNNQSAWMPTVADHLTEGLA
ncbi:alpha/beta hydrolase family protein [Nocardia mangyaensis]|uniref:alpha/beta hydrolase family protein n=1 Tax=Nocardia mangyaensis TaxID=2213200 RepID=UPI0026744763|nr:alpha/beta fold hydrolase [Nocardia mangyaensis]MDO3650628.1 alpha/beta fold hydrolase [Nocardia mangyaensis]